MAYKPDPSTAFTFDNDDRFVSQQPKGPDPLSANWSYDSAIDLFSLNTMLPETLPLDIPNDMLLDPKDFHVDLFAPPADISGFAISHSGEDSLSSVRSYYYQVYKLTDKKSRIWKVTINHGLPPAVSHHSTRPQMPPASRHAQLKSQQPAAEQPPRNVKKLPAGPPALKSRRKNAPFPHRRPPLALLHPSLPARPQPPARTRAVSPPTRKQQQAATPPSELPTTSSRSGTAPT